ncbi:MAG: DtxR family transcriptional regulator [Candidatus Hadarchaeia archaeon]
MNLSESEEEYLESLYKLTRKRERVRVSDLAEDLDLSQPSVVEMLKKLERKDLVKYEKSLGCELTEKGEKIGMGVSRRHRLAERLLTDMLNRDLSQVHDEACKLEHSLEDKTADEIARVLGDPNTCPHGRPIPERGEERSEEDMIKLSEGDEGKEYNVVAIPEESEHVQRLLPLAILPGTNIELTENPSSGALMIRRGSDKLALSRNIASEIEVRECGRGEGRRHRRRIGR